MRLPSALCIALATSVFPTPESPIKKSDKILCSPILLNTLYAVTNFLNSSLKRSCPYKLASNTLKKSSNSLSFKSTILRFRDGVSIIVSFSAIISSEAASTSEKSSNIYRKIYLISSSYILSQIKSIFSPKESKSCSKSICCESFVFVYPITDERST